MQRARYNMIVQLSESRCHRRCRRCPRSQLINSSSPLIGIHFISYETESWGLVESSTKCAYSFNQSKQQFHMGELMWRLSIWQCHKTHTRDRRERLKDWQIAGRHLLLQLVQSTGAQPYHQRCWRFGERWKLLSLWCDARRSIGFVCSVDRISLISFHFSSPYFFPIDI